MEQKMSPQSSRYRFSQVFGQNQSIQILDQDIISCLKFDPSGKYLCVGDHASRVIIFQIISNNITSSNKFNKNIYRYYGQFQSHVRQFDPLKGQQYSQSLIDISILRPQGKYLKILTSNTRSIKFWKTYQKINKKIIQSSSNQIFNFPILQSKNTIFTANQQFIFPLVHTTDINSISHSNNQQYLLSSDKKQSLLWSLQKPIRPYITNTIQQNQINITCSKMHPSSDSIFVYGINKCQLNLCDIRDSTLTGNAIKFGKQTAIKPYNNFFTDMIASIHSIDFTQNNKYIVSREYLNVKIWDITNTNKPIHNICIQDNIKTKLINLFQNDNIYDKFNIGVSYDSNTIVTGNYNNCFHLINLQNGLNTQYQLNSKKNTIKRSIIPGKCSPLVKFDTKKKTSVTTFHPSHPSVAISLLNSFFIYSL